MAEALQHDMWDCWDDKLTPFDQALEAAAKECETVSPDPATLCDLLEEKTLISEGTYARVYRIGEKLALKQFRGAGELHDAHVRELRTLNLISHLPDAHLLCLRKAAVINHNEKNALGLYFDFYPYSLEGIIFGRGSSERTLDERAMLGIVRALLVASAALSRLGTLTRDFKPSNVLIAASGDVCLADFNFASALQFGRCDKPLHSYVQTPRFRAPELLDVRSDSLSAYDARADVWSIGVIFLCMILRRHPFTDTPSDLARLRQFRRKNGALLGEKLPRLLRRSKRLSPASSQLLLAMLSVDVSIRPTAQECLRQLDECTRLLDLHEGVETPMSEFELRRRYADALRRHLPQDAEMLHDKVRHAYERDSADAS
ncbi:MAG: hypothetical protein MHM6MM_001577 [Cercozoa sp. M6MM]